jgi:hypothetical protein
MIQDRSRRGEDGCGETDLPCDEVEFERLLRQEREIRNRIKSFTASDNLSRDDLYRRDLFRES